MKNPNCFFTALLISLAAVPTSNGQWESLIKKDLGNWTQLNGTARYDLRNGEIVGTTVLGSPNSFLCSKETYGDFILEFDAWVDPKMNSGVQIRSESRPDYQNGTVHGYQVELDPSPRAWSGGIYDEARRQWLYPLERNPAGRKAFKSEAWNHFRVEAVGHSIRTWVNGVPGADLIDDLTPAGFIGLQVHGIRQDASLAGLEMKWRNIRILTKEVAKHATPYTPVIPQNSYLNNTLSAREAKEGWKLLWDGKTPTGWRGAKLKTFPADVWVMKDGVLAVVASGGRESAAGGDIVTLDRFKNFELSVDFRYTLKTNSGIKYLVDTELNKGEGSAIGCEYQIMDVKKGPDGKPLAASKDSLAGLYDLIPPKVMPTNGPGQWNRATIIVKGNQVEHWLNHQMTVAYERGNARWRELVAQSKFKVWPNFGEGREGNILLQEHGGLVSFRNIKIREFKD